MTNQPSHRSRATARIVETRDRKKPLRVFVTDSERVEIERRAALAGMSISMYLRTTGLNHKIQSTLDFEGVCELVKVAGDQGRLGGLLTRWLSERPGQGVSSIDVRQLLIETRALQARIRDKMGRV